LRNYYNLLTLMGSTLSDKPTNNDDNDGNPINEEEEEKISQMKKMDILSEVMYSGTDIKVDEDRVSYKNVLVNMLQDKMYSVFPIPNRVTNYSDLYMDNNYVHAAFDKVEWMKHHLISINLHILLASKKYAREKARLWQVYPDDGGREGLVELVAVYNLCKTNKKMF